MPQIAQKQEAAPYHSDTIVVKDEQETWPRPSSPESMSPEADVTTLLAQINTPQDLESPDPSDDDNDISPENLSADLRSNQVARTPRQRHRLTATTMEERLQAMPTQRPLPWRDGVEAGAETETGGESRRKQIRFGCLLATRGEVQDVPCNSCANGRGKFNVCVALDGYFKGACASCQLSGRPNRCSIKRNDGGEIMGSPTLDPPINHDLETLSPNNYTHPTQDAPQSKRRKTESIPEWERERPQWEQELGESHARLQMNEIVQRPWATVNSPATMAGPQAMMSGMNGSSSRTLPLTGDHRNSMGWATVNQPVPGPQPYGNGVDTGGPVYRPTLEQDRREETVMNDEASVALIDTLPKNKQRQVYGLVSGLQGGIEHLQKELDSLKRALGIDDED